MSAASVSGLEGGKLAAANSRRPSTSRRGLSLLTDFENYRDFRPGDLALRALETLLDEAVAWSTALAASRAS